MSSGVRLRATGAALLVAVRAARAAAVAGHGARLRSSAAVSLQLDLQSMSVSASGSEAAAEAANWGAQMASVRLPGGGEVACLNCDVDSFAEWVEEVVIGAGTPKHRDGAQAGGAAGSGGKHPNAPGYAKWAKEHGVTLLQRQPAPSPLPPMKPAWQRLNVTVAALHMGQIAELRPRLKHLWSTRSLVLGYGADPLRQRMDFGEALVDLARSSPAFVPADCGTFGDSAPFCGALLSDGLEKSASEEELKATLDETFGAEFLRQHAFDRTWSAKEQRAHLQALLTALKGQYHFYRQTCLAHSAASRGCDQKAPSDLIGRIACSPNDDLGGSGCVYAELRRCRSDACSSSPGFFEYARFHGPLQLLRTKGSRDQVMGQCEEFSRAAYALVSSLGYQARYVLDFTDHVWIEVRLRREGSAPTDFTDTEWVHADPSEGVLGNPLMYEQGWGKQLTMIYAMTPWSIEHVTHRYTKDYAATEARRGIPEKTLTAVLEMVNNRLEYELPTRSWGHGWSSNGAKLSRDRDFEDLALWSHFA